MVFYVFKKLGRIDSNGAHTCQGSFKTFARSFPTYNLAERYIHNCLFDYLGDLSSPHFVYKIYVKENYRFKPVSKWFFL